MPRGTLGASALIAAMTAGSNDISASGPVVGRAASRDRLEEGAVGRLPTRS